MLSYFSRDVFDEILDLTESVTEGFPIKSCVQLNQVERGQEMGAPKTSWPRGYKTFFKLRQAYNTIFPADIC